MKRFALLMLAACGSSSSHRASVTGSIAGTPFSASDSAAIVVKRALPQVVDVLVTNLPDSCAGGGNVKSKQVLELALLATSGTLDGGSYPVVDSPPPGGSYVLVNYGSTNASCGDSTPPNSRGASGRVTLTRVDLDGGVAGDFDIILQSGDRLKGTFDAPICPGRPDAGAADAGCH
jgi:hypothetical protein